MSSTFNTTEPDAQADENNRLRSALGDLIGAYVRLLGAGRDRIIGMGGQCDTVDIMEASDPHLRAARVALAQHQRSSA